jgi:hypothetical protein
METACFSKTLALTYKSTWCQNPRLHQHENVIKFRPIANNSPQHALIIGYEKNTEKSVNTKFLGLQIDSRLNWKNLIDQIIPNLCRACDTVGLMFHISNTDTFKSIYFACFHSLIKYDTYLGVIHLSVK